MREDEIGRAMRSLRHRRGLRQVDLCARARRPRSALVDLESGRLGGAKLDTIRAFADALGARLTLNFSSGAGDPRLLVDAAHAYLLEHWKRRLEGWGWMVRAELSFNHYGDRGRIDLLAYLPSLQLLLVIEVKTVLWDVQALLGGLDVKVRVAPHVVRELGWRPEVVLPMVVFAAGTTVRRRLVAHPSLFVRLELRGRPAASWLRHPQIGPGGLLVLTDLPDVAVGDRRRAGRRRVRLSLARSSSARA